MNNSFCPRSLYSLGTGKYSSPYTCPVDHKTKVILPLSVGRYCSFKCQFLPSQPTCMYRIVLGKCHKRPCTSYQGVNVAVYGSQEGQSAAIRYHRRHRRRQHRRYHRRRRRRHHRRCLHRRRRQHHRWCLRRCRHRRLCRQWRILGNISLRPSKRNILRQCFLLIDLNQRGDLRPRSPFCT